MYTSGGAASAFAGVCAVLARGFRTLACGADCAEWHRATSGIVRLRASSFLAGVLMVLTLTLFVAPGHAAGNAAVSIANFAFHPNTITVVIGVNNTVTWTNNDATTHTVTSDNSLFPGGTLAPGATYTSTFDQAGTYAYHCSIHPTMTGVVHVVSQTSTTTSSSASVSSSSSSTRSSSSGSSTGIPEFPAQLGFALLFTVAIVASYVVARRGLRIGKQSPV